MADSLATPSVPGFRPLAPLLAAIPPDALHAARSRLAELDRETLIAKFRAAFNSGKRTLAFMLAAELTVSGIPPVFRLDHRSSKIYSTNQNFDLLVYDFRWLRHEYPEHHKRVRYARYKLLLTGRESEFHYAALHAFSYSKLKEGDRGGLRSTCEVVRMLSVSDAMQYDCAVLHSAHVKKRIEATEAMRDHVFSIVQDSIRGVRKTSNFDKDDAKKTLFKRHRVWLCSRLTESGSPTETAARFQQLTGDTLTRFAARDQLEKVKKSLKDNDVTST